MAKLSEPSFNIKKEEEEEEDIRRRNAAINYHTIHRQVLINVLTRKRNKMQYTMYLPEVLQ